MSKKPFEMTDAHMANPGWSAEAFAKARKDNGVNQEEIAAKAGFTQSFVSHIENRVTPMNKDNGGKLWGALFEIVEERGERQIQAARERAIALRGTPEGEAEAKRSAAWIEGWNTAGGMMGWAEAGEKESMQKLIESQQRLIAAQQDEIGIHQKQSNWQPVLIELSEKIKRQDELIALLVQLLDVKTTEGLALKQAEELREEIAVRLKKDRG